jgi:REP element-mobilizing transposase RayT
MERYRIGPDAAVYFVTFSVVDWLPVFISEPACRIIVDSLNYCHDRKALRINAYVIMPTHIHAIVFDSSFDAQQLEGTLTDFRKFTGRALSDYCVSNMPQSFTDGFRAAAPNDRDRRFWQPTRHPVALQTERFYRQRLDYLHDNPCRKGLVRRAEHWRFSSALYYVSDGRESVDVTITPLEWL